MNADLENELREHPALRPVVDRLCASREIPLPIRPIQRSGSVCSWRLFGVSSSLLAASLLAAAAFAFWLGSDSRNPSAPSSPGAREYRLTPAEMIATQNADGSWQNDFLTRRNAEALRLCEVPGAQIAYKKAMRNLRVRGIL